MATENVAGSDLPSRVRRPIRADYSYLAIRDPRLISSSGCLVEAPSLLVEPNQNHYSATCLKFWMPFSNSGTNFVACPIPSNPAVDVCTLRTSTTPHNIERSHSAWFLSNPGGGSAKLRKTTTASSLAARRTARESRLR